MKKTEEKKKYVYPLMVRHMDLVWRRRFKGQLIAEGKMFRGYSEIEDLIFDQIIDMCEQYGFPGASECAMQIRCHLERNPDQLERVKKLVSEGKLELEGGGEALIDTNLVCGESLYRNLYNGMAYYRDVFGSSSISAQCCDIFGLSAQLPQIFRQFGLLNVNNFSRVFKNRKTFWKGLDGSIVALRCVEEFGDWCWVGHSGAPCEICKGEGCVACHYTGIDNTRRENEKNDPEHIEVLEDYFKQNKDKDVLYMLENGEETLYPDRFPELYEKEVRKHGFEPVYYSYDKYFTELFTEDYKALLSGNVPLDKIDPRVEGNPVFCGCYTSRIKVKQLNRMLEDMLLSAETLSTSAFDKECYPFKTLTNIWRDMELLQFHDAITGSHSDAAYDELMTLCREIARGGMKLVDKSLAVLLDGGDGFTLFNLTDTDVVSAPLTAHFRVTDDTEFVEIYDDNGNKLPVASVKRMNQLFGAMLEVTFIGDIGAYSAKHFTFKKAEAQKAKEIDDGIGTFIENEYYRIDRGGVFDKTLGRRITKTGAILLTDEIGDPWSKFDPETAFISLTGTTTTANVTENKSEIVFSGCYSNEKLGARNLTYKVTATLFKGVRGVYYKTDIDWDGENCHIYADFPLTFSPKGKALYEIPFGTLERGFVDFQNDAQSIADSYPAVGFAACRDEKNGYTVALLNKGIPGYRVNEDSIWLSLLRSPTQDKHGGLWFDGAREIGHYEFEYMLTSFEGTKDSDGDLVRMARFYNHAMPCGKGKPAKSEFAFAKSEDGAVISSVRRTKDGFVQVRAYEPYGNKATLELSRTFAETLPLDENADNGKNVGNKFEFRPYEIKTLTVKE